MQVELCISDISYILDAVDERNIIRTYLLDLILLITAAINAFGWRNPGNSWRSLTNSFKKHLYRPNYQYHLIYYSFCTRTTTIVARLIYCWRWQQLHFKVHDRTINLQHPWFTLHQQSNYKLIHTQYICSYISC